jgi:hypothetical protein
MMKAFLSAQHGAPPSQPPSSSVPLITYSYGMPSNPMPSSSTSVQPVGTQVPIHLLQFPPSPSPIPTWAYGSSAAPYPGAAPVYSSSPLRTSISSAPSTGALVAHGGPYASGTMYGGVDGLLFHAATAASTATATAVPAYHDGPPGPDWGCFYDHHPLGRGSGLDRPPGR